MRTRATCSVAVEHHARIVLFTDGLVKQRDEPLDVGLDRLACVLAKHRTDDVDATAESLLGDLALSAMQRDDIALLVADLETVPDEFHETISAGLDELRPLRARIHTWLADSFVEPDVADDLAIAINEGVANAIEHGSSDESAIVGIAARRTADQVEVEITDPGTPRVGVNDPDRGRGVHDHARPHGRRDVHAVARGHHGSDAAEPRPTVNTGGEEVSAGAFTHRRRQSHRRRHGVFGRGCCGTRRVGDARARAGATAPRLVYGDSLTWEAQAGIEQDLEAQLPGWDRSCGRCPAPRRALHSPRCRADGNLNAGVVVLEYVGVPFGPCMAGKDALAQHTADTQTALGAVGVTRRAGGARRRAAGCRPAT